MTRTTPAWAILSRSKNRLDGAREYLIRDPSTRAPLLRNTKREAGEWIEEHYGYLRNRPDLRAEPHGWRMPRPVRVDVVRRKL